MHISMRRNHVLPENNDNPIEVKCYWTKYRRVFWFYTSMFVFMIFVFESDLISASPPLFIRSNNNDGHYSMFQNKFEFIEIGFVVAVYLANWKCVNLLKKMPQNWLKKTLDRGVSLFWWYFLLLLLLSLIEHLLLIAGGMLLKLFTCLHFIMIFILFYWTFNSIEL